MSWVTVIWSMAASACLTLATVYLLVWCQKRTTWSYLLFAVAALATAAVAGGELCLMRAQTPGHLATMVRWIHVPIWVVFVATVGFVRLHLRAGRPWLAWSACVLRTASLLINFLVPQNLNYREITRVLQVPFLGDTVSLAQGVVNPWMLIGQLSLAFYFAFAVDAAVTVWRRRDGPAALLTSSSIAFFVLVGGAQAALVVRGVLHWPFTMSLPFLGIVAAMAYELTRAVLGAARLADDLRASEVRYRGIFEGAVEGMFRASVEGKCTLANTAMARMLGYGSAAEAMREILDTAQQVWAEPQERARHLRRAEVEGFARAHECQFRRKDGTRIWVSLSTRAVRGPDGRVAHYEGFVEDISERRRVAEALERSEEQYRLLFEQMHSGIIVLDVILDPAGNAVDHRLVQANAEFEAQTGLQRGEQIGKTSAALAFQWPEEVRQRYYQVALDGEPLHGEWSNESLKRFYDVRVFSPRRGQFAVLFHDITARKQAEADLRESEERLREAAEAAGFGVYRYDLVSGAAFHSREFLALYGLPAGAALGLDADRVPTAVHPDDRGLFLAALSRSSDPTGAGIFDAEFRIVLSDGRVRWLRGRGRCLFDGAGPSRRPVRANGIIQDISVRRLAEQELGLQRRQLAHVARVAAVSQLASSLAHELNQPLGAILRNAEAAEMLLQDAAPDLDEVRAILEDIRKDDQRAGAVIDRMRALMKRRDVKRVPLDLGQLAGDVIALARPDADMRHVALTLETVPALPLVQGDRVQLQQVLLNLLLNAMDAMGESRPPDGRVTVRVRPADAAVEVSVRDCGCGIPADVLPRLFEPFFTNKPNGMGMGLAISKSIVEAHRGRLWAENNVGGGATLTFVLPVAAEE